MRAKSSTLNHQEGAALLDEQPASLKITVNALPSSAPSPILTSGRGGGEENASVLSPKRFFTAALRFSANHVGNQARRSDRAPGFIFCFLPKTERVLQKKKKKSGWFLRFDELESTFSRHASWTVTHVPSAHRLEAPENAAGRQHPRSAAGRPMNKR